MAVHVITLGALKRWSAALGAAPPAPPEPAAPTPPPVQPTPTAAAPVPFAKPDEPGLGLTPREIEALVAQSGHEGGKALLSLILRLSSLETQIADLRARVAAGSTGAAPPPPPMSAPMPSAPSLSPKKASASGKDGILEQIFNNNQALWDSLDDEPGAPDEPPSAKG